MTQPDRVAELAGLSYRRGKFSAGLIALDDGLDVIITAAKLVVAKSQGSRSRQSRRVAVDAPFSSKVPTEKWGEFGENGLLEGQNPTKKHSR
jgi:hypothetical protein